MAGDAGSTIGTAADLGVLNDSRTLSGSLSVWDTADWMRIEIPTASRVAFTLDPQRVDADLTIADASGRTLAHSNRSGTAQEQISGELSPGVYYVGVTAQSWWRNTYRLGLSATPIIVTPPPVIPPATETPTNNTPTPNTGGGTSSAIVSPLADVPYFGTSRDWNLNAINAPEAWAAGYVGQGVTVAVVDTGVDWDHPDLVNQIYVNPGEIPGNGIDDDGNGFVDDVRGWDFAGRDNNPDDVNGHGTHVAGTIAASNNGVGATGVAPGARILPVRVLGDNGSGSTNDVAAGIRYAANMGAQIINLSLGGGFSTAIQSAITYARSLGSLIVAAAGNESASVPGWPAQFSASMNNVLSVGAFDSGGRVAGFSNDVGRSGSVQVDAPGVGITNTFANGRTATLSGTSMAAPHVAGLAALALSANPLLTATQLRDLITGGVTGSAIGSDSLGTINAATTVAYAAAGMTSANTSRSATSPNSPTSSAQSYRTTSQPAPELVIAPESYLPKSTDHNESLERLIEQLAIARGVSF